MGVFPAPDDGVGLIHDHPRGVEMVGMDIVHLYFTGSGGFRDYADRNITQPDGFLPYQPIIRLWRGCIVAVFADQLSVGVAKEEKLRTQWTILDDALILDGASLLGYLLC